MDKQTHAIVWFKGEYTRDGKKIIDLVPLSWLEYEKDKIYCRYPPKTLQRLVRTWCERSKEPNLKWTQSEVEVLKFACKYLL